MAPFIPIRGSVPTIKQPVWVVQTHQKNALKQTLEAPCCK